MSDEELIDGIYTLVMPIATGGSSQVWECVEQGTARHLAMKLLKQDVPDFKENKGNMKHEADVLKSVEHPLIVKFERYSSSRDATYLLMEYFRAPNVKLQLKADMRSVHVRARTLFEGTCQALAMVHSKGWIHRDVKPDNILMNKVGEIRLVDFSLATKEVKGFAKMIGGGKIKTIQGTRTYIAPETIRKQPLAFQTDIYSLGIMFFEVLTGRTPFQAPTPEELLRRHLRDEPPYASEFNKNVSAEMDRLILRMLKKKIADRPATVDEVLAEVKRMRIFKEDVTDAVKNDDDNAKSMDELTDLRLDSRADAKLSLMLNANPELARQFAEDKLAKSVAKKANAAKVSAAAKVTTDREAAKAATKGGKPGQAPPPPQMMPPQMMPQPMMPGGFGPQPGYPQFPPQPQFGMPGAFPPGMMPPGMAPPGMMPPGMPGYPGGPQPGFAPQGMPPGFTPAGMPPGTGMPPGFAPQMAPPMPGLPPVQPGVPPQAVRPVAPPAQPPTRPIAPAPIAAAPPKPPAPQPRPASPPPAAAAKPEELDYMTELPDIL
ncbi:MAG TPA: serine/threonine-protein kinase [Schlesneria sp.]